MFEMMKYKKIPKNYLKICLDRLTRFKPVYEKYERVFYDILNKFLIADSKTDFNKGNMDIDTICNTVSIIFNASIPFEYDSFLSEILLDEEKNTFKLDDNELKFLTAGLNISGAVKFLSDEPGLPLNLERLKLLQLNKKADPLNLRKQFSLIYPVSKVILAEGATEEILLSKFALSLGYDFNEEGIYVLGAGGKNQVARKYYKMVDEIKLPVFILLDFDAFETRELIMTKLRPKDKIHLIKSGEFEDILPLDLVINAINDNFSNNLHCTKEDFNFDYKMTKNLHNLFKNKGFGEYKKADFAKMIKFYLEKEQSISKSVKENISLEIKEIIEEIKKL